MKLQYRADKFQYTLTIPARVVKEFGWEKHDDLSIEVDREKKGVFIYHLGKKLKAQEKPREERAYHLIKPSSLIRDNTKTHTSSPLKSYRF